MSTFVTAPRLLRGLSNSQSLPTHQNRQLALLQVFAGNLCDAGHPDAKMEILIGAFSLL